MMLDRLVDLEQRELDRNDDYISEFDIEYGNAILKAYYGSQIPCVNSIEALLRRLEMLALRGDTNAELFLELHYNATLDDD